MLRRAGAAAPVVVDRTLAKVATVLDGGSAAVLPAAEVDAPRRLAGIVAERDDGEDDDVGVVSDVFHHHHQYHCYPVPWMEIFSSDFPNSYVALGCPAAEHSSCCR